MMVKEQDMKGFKSEELKTVWHSKTKKMFEH